MKQPSEFWNKEYKNPEHFSLSAEPAEDLAKFTRWLGRNAEANPHRQKLVALDLGCGNGRNLIFLAREFGAQGYGYDISQEAINQARKAGQGLPVTFEARSIAGKIDLPDESVDIILDMMTSHFLKSEDRKMLLSEIVRVLKPGGWMFFKSFLEDEDAHAKRLIKENPADEEHAYIHPRIGVYEYVWSEQRLTEFFEPYFEIHKIEPSHKHILHGKAFKRRTVTAYMEKNY